MNHKTATTRRQFIDACAALNLDEEPASLLYYKLGDGDFIQIGDTRITVNRHTFAQQGRYRNHG